MASESFLAQAIAEQATPVVGARTDFDPLVERIGDARFVLLGGATHGSHEFYRIRADLTKRLIREKGFSAVAVEADWPDAYRINRYIRGVGRDLDAADALVEFRRFPRWMWRNADVLDLIGWMRAFNDRLWDPKERVGFYGLDLYSLYASLAAMLSYLDGSNREAASRTREWFASFEVCDEPPQSLGLPPDSEEMVLAQLVDRLKRRGELVRRVGVFAEDAQLEADQHARAIASAEDYYRMVFLRGVSTWNLRATHMADTLDALAEHLERRGRPGKVVVWAHNALVGDASAMTARAAHDEVTLGRLSRQRHPGETMLVGLTTYAGTVTAATDWGGVAERKVVQPAVAGSYEELFHRTGVPAFLLLLDRLGEATAALHEARLERAIGCVYRPDNERFSHYFDVRLADQLDAVVHVDQTRALEPLDRTAGWERGEAESHPDGL